MNRPPAPNGIEHPREALPTRLAALCFSVKAACFQAQRAWRDLSSGGPRRHPRSQSLPLTPVVGTQSSDIWFETNVASEKRLQFGKVQNLRLAATLLRGAEVPAGAVWSFWRELGRTTARRGFAVGRELREGCLIPTLGGGLCQLSGAIYNAALEAGLEIVERHAHSHPGVGNLAAAGRDATVFWNYVDLRLRAPFPWRLDVELTATRLIVRIRSTKTVSALNAPTPPKPSRIAFTTAPQPGSCASCGVAACFRHLKPDTDDNPGRSAWLVDEWWPEWATHLSQLESHADLLLRPLDGRRWRKPNYAWDATHFARTRSATFLTLQRAWATRRLREQGAQRQRALLAWDERLARHYGRLLHPEHTHLVVAQNLLPFLWRDGVLGGRTFDVLMVRMPIRSLQAELDLAARLHPESKTCADFRAPAWLVQTEAEALAAADHWITPHRAIAELAGTRAVVVPWNMPAAAKQVRANGQRVIFPASALCRKGAYEMRAAAQSLDCELVCLGSTIEGAAFWNGVRTAASSPTPQVTSPTTDLHWLDEAAAVVLPAFVEHRPRRLLAAIARGIPVIATRQCGLGDLLGVTEVPAGDAQALVNALEQVLQERSLASV
ncbi:MAG TPA: VanW family protein [Chthoniobacter sp.]|jgi:hypothetical protein